MEVVLFSILLVGIFNIKDNPYNLQYLPILLLISLLADVHPAITGSSANSGYDGDVATRNFFRSEQPSVSFALFTRENPDLPLTIDNQAMEKFRNTTSNVIFLIHGWMSSPAAWYEDVRLAFLQRDESSMVIEVDWSEQAFGFYFSQTATAATLNDVSSQIANLVVNLYKHYGVPRENFLLVGHSLGGQISGFVGKAFQKRTSEKLPRIIALDPAGPSFEQVPKEMEDQRLNREDAEVVEVIHTNNMFGFKRRCGTIDFFVNGGKQQPGCSVRAQLSCHHHRAIEYFAEALIDPKAFVARKCDNYQSMGINPAYSCDHHVSVCLGDINTTLSGVFYLETNGDEPYAKEHGSRSLLEDLMVPFLG